MYKYFQPNKKDIKDKYGDCAIRSVCACEGISWLCAYDYMYKVSREVQCPMNCKEGFEHVVKSLGYRYGKISNSKGSKRPTVKQFAKEHKQGSYILVVANHYVACVNGMYMDTWDSGNCCLYGYWEKPSDTKEAIVNHFLK